MKAILFLALSVLVSSCCHFPKCGPGEKFACPKTTVFEDMEKVGGPGE